MKKLSILLLMIVTFSFGQTSIKDVWNVGNAPDFMGSAPFTILYTESGKFYAVGSMDVGYSYGPDGGLFTISFYGAPKDKPRIYLYTMTCNKAVLNNVINGFNRLATAKPDDEIVISKVETGLLTQEWGFRGIDILVSTVFKPLDAIGLNAGKMSTGVGSQYYFVESDQFKIHQKDAVVALFNKAIAHQLKQIEARKVKS